LEGFYGKDEASEILIAATGIVINIPGGSRSKRAANVILPVRQPLQMKRALTSLIPGCFAFEIRTLT